MTLPITDNSLAFVAIQAALRAGQILRQGFGTLFTISSKANALDLVTPFDKAAEESIISFIRQHFPDHSFLAEESGSCGTTNSRVQWVIDPLDGTMNFAHNIPMFVVSIAAVVDGITEIGVIYQPLTHDLYAAQKGRGAYLNGIPIKTSQTTLLESAVGATGFPYGPTETREKCIDQFLRFLEVGNPIRILGSAALNLAYIAAGKFDVYWGMNLQPWDMAAGALLIEEAGGTITHFDGSPHNFYLHQNIVASNGFLHQAVLNNLQ